MPNYNDIQGTTIFVNTNPIPEPLAPPTIFAQSLERFDPAIYNTTLDSHLYKFLLALAGDSGAGLVSKQVSYARFQSRLNSTHFTDLDKFYSILGIPRLASERYNANEIDGAPLDPRGQVVTFNQWQEIILKDASYRARCLSWMEALILGGTPEGLAKAAEAALGVECFVYENYKYLDSTYNTGTQPNLGNYLNNRKQFIVIPQIPQNEVTQEQQYYLYNLLNRLKPAGTFFTINYANSPRQTIVSADVLSSSTYFYVQRIVTGNNNLNWPAIDSNQGYWIEPGVANPAPSPAFLQSQEYVTNYTISTATASSYNIGAFNLDQQEFFSNLANTSIVPLISYLPTYSYSVNETPVYSTASWTNSYNSDNPLLMVNTYYPLNYFSITNTQFLPDSPFRFWASTENAQGTSEYLILDLGSSEQVNFIDLEITQKPISFSFEYSVDNINWTPAVFSSEFNYSDQINFVPSALSPWIYYQAHFNVFMARYIKINFNRAGQLTDPTTYLPFNYSIDVKNVRISHQINNLEDLLDENTGLPATESTIDFVVDSGIDFFGNNYTTDLILLNPNTVTNNNNTSYWQSQPNPSPLAVENLYFDLRDSNENPQTITEIYIDPITPGCNMHFYWTNDDSNDDNWDNKLWNTISNNYILKKGYYYLPSPLTAKYFKIEFSNLVPIPYNPIEYPQTPAIIYNRFPTWVQDYFLSFFPITLNATNLQFPYGNVLLTTGNTGFEYTSTISNNGDQQFPPNVSILSNAILESQNELVVSSTRPSVQSQNRTKVGNQIKIVNNTTFKNTLNNFDLTDPLSRYLFNTSVNETKTSNVLLSAEQATPIYPYPQYQSAIDLTQEEINKKLPIMYFPFTSRHQYQQLSVQRTNKIAWIVGIQFVGFYRRDFGQQYDEPYYSETLADSFSFQQNDFEPNVWNFTVV